MLTNYRKQNYILTAVLYGLNNITNFFPHEVSILSLKEEEKNNNKPK